jgi:hypothetical protein
MQMSAPSIKIWGIKPSPGVHEKIQFTIVAVASPIASAAVIQTLCGIFQ